MQSLILTWPSSGTDTLEESGPLAPLRPLLPSVCHMAACEASAALVPGAGATEPPDDEGWGEAALVAALMAVSRVQGSGEFCMISTS